MGRKMFLERGGGSWWGGLEEKKSREYIRHTNNENSSHYGQFANITPCIIYVHLYVCDFIKFLTTATLPSGKFRNRLFLDKVTSLLSCLYSQPQKDRSSVNSSNATKACIGNLESEIYKQIKTYGFVFIRLFLISIQQKYFGNGNVVTPTQWSRWCMN